MLRPPTVLLVEDDVDTRETLALVLAAVLDAQIEVANDGDEARRRIESAPRPPDLVITDERMPNVSGGDLIRWIRDRVPGVPCVLMSAYHDGSRIAREAGADLFLSKPFSVREAQPLLKGLLAQAT